MSKGCQGPPSSQGDSRCTRGTATYCGTLPKDPSPEGDVGVPARGCHDAGGVPVGHEVAHVLALRAVVVVGPGVRSNFGGVVDAVSTNAGGVLGGIQVLGGR